MTSLGERTWRELDAQDRLIVAVPLGSTEQHGPHLPLSTDTDIASALCRRLAAARQDVVVAPALSYGSSGEHASFPGTLSIGQDALELVLLELGRSASDSFDGLVFVNGHGGNGAALNRAVRRLRDEGRDVLAYSPVWEGDAHAGRAETALMLSVRPELVRVASAEPGNTAELADLLPRLRTDGVRAVSANGVLGDPTGATADEGGSLLDALASRLVTAVAEWRG